MFLPFLLYRKGDRKDMLLQGGKGNLLVYSFLQQVFCYTTLLPIIALTQIRLFFPCCYCYYIVNGEYIMTTTMTF